MNQLLFLFLFKYFVAVTIHCSKLNELDKRSIAQKAAEYFIYICMFTDVFYLKLIC